MRGNWPVLIASVIDTTSPVACCRMQEDSADALAGYPGSHLDSVAEFLVGQYQKDAVGPMLGSSGSSATSGEQPAAIPPAAAAAAADAAASGSMLDLVMEVLGRQALVQAADSTDGGGGGIGCSVANGSAGASSLAQLLQGLDAACSAAFDRTPELISPTLALTGSVRLGPGPSAVAAGYLSSSGPAAAVVAVAWEGQHKVMLLRSSSDGNSGGGQAGWEAALVHLPADNGAAMDLAFYKEGQLALLLAGSGGSAPAQDSGSACQLALLPQEHMQFVQLPAELLADSNALQLCEMLLESSTGSSGTPLAGDCRQRPVPYPRVQQPLAVSASRGVGCVMAGTQVGTAACLACLLSRALASQHPSLHGCHPGMLSTPSEQPAHLPPCAACSACCCTTWKRMRGSRWKKRRRAAPGKRVQQTTWTARAATSRPPASEHTPGPPRLVCWLPVPCLNCSA